MSYISRLHSIIQNKLALKATGASVGAGGVAVSSLTSGNFTTSSTTFVPVTNLSVVLNTTGRPVMVMLVGDGPSGGSFVGCNTSVSSGQPRLILRFNNSTIGNIGFHVVGGSTPSSTISIVTPASISLLDFPAAVTNTYSVSASVDSGTSTGSVGACRLIAYEI